MLLLVLFLFGSCTVRRTCCHGRMDGIMTPAGYLLHSRDRSSQHLRLFPPAPYLPHLSSVTGQAAGCDAMRALGGPLDPHTSFFSRF